ncbi:MAG: hypothetical protein K0Q55_115 [Verrucomicrobia bacterium]|jgi:hypothetical protein|nr:hypothetical protein [Verrucomicrobiota bacterium]
MNRKHFLCALGLPLVIAGCKTPEAAVEEHKEIPLSKKSVRSNCYSLLHDLLSKQRNVSKVLIIKNERLELKDLIQRIADTSGRGADLIKVFSKVDPAITLELTQLPPGEVATRDAIEAMRTQQLLNTSGREFETNLLFTQTESMNYACHLAKVCAIYEPSGDWSRQLKDLSREFEVLQKQAVSLLLANR